MVAVRDTFVAHKAMWADVEAMDQAKMVEVQKMLTLVSLAPDEQVQETCLVGVNNLLYKIK